MLFTNLPKTKTLALFYPTTLLLLSLGPLLITSSLLLGFKICFPSLRQWAGYSGCLLYLWFQVDVVGPYMYACYPSITLAKSLLSKDSSKIDLVSRYRFYVYNKWRYVIGESMPGFIKLYD